MSRIRTVFDLNQTLSEEMAWRTRELHTMKAHIYSVRNTIAINALLRAGITVLYAHWEGFIKRAAQAYLEFVSRQRLTRAQVIDPILAVAARSVLQRGTDAKQAQFHIRIVEFFLNEM